MSSDKNSPKPTMIALCKQVFSFASFKNKSVFLLFKRKIALSVSDSETAIIKGVPSDLEKEF